jgi:hypothetical protein
MLGAIGRRGFPSATRIEWARLIQACAVADIVVSDRRLPRGCSPRWLKLDAPTLRRIGGLAVYLGSEPRVDSFPTGSVAPTWADRPLRRAPHRELTPAWVDEMKPAAARE